jgi:hypothetical protein
MRVQRRIFLKIVGAAIVGTPTILGAQGNATMQRNEIDMEITRADSQPSTKGPSGENTNSSPATTKMRIKIGSSTFLAALDDNPTAAAFKAMLPLTVDMQELNGNEKLYRLPNKLPTKATNPGKIETGDLMLYGANTVVLFYKSFPTSYSYTRLGRINDPAGLAAAVGSASVVVTFELVSKP